MDKNDIVEIFYEDLNKFQLMGAGKLVQNKDNYIHLTRTIDSYEIIVVHRGVLFMREKNSYYELRPGDMLLLEPGLEHGGYKHTKGNISFFWLHFFAHEINIRKENYLNILFTKRKVMDNVQSVCVPKCMSFKNPYNIYDAFTDYLSEVKRDSIYKYNRMMSKFVLLNLNIIDDLILSKNIYNEPTDTKLSHIWNIIDFISKNSAKGISIKDICEYVNINHDYANRIFREVNACSIQEYMIRVRIEKARDLLENSNLNISEISEQIGYNDPYYFSRIFKKKTNLSPKNYRNIIYKVRN